MYDYVSGSYPAPEAGSQRPWQVLVGHPFKHGVASCPVGFVGGCVGVARVGVAGDVERGLRHKSQGGGSHTKASEDVSVHPFVQLWCCVCDITALFCCSVGVNSWWPPSYRVHAGATTRCSPPPLIGRRRPGTGGGLRG